MTIIDVEKLCRTYVRKTGGGWFKRRGCVETRAVRDLSFSIAAGERVAFIGPNGAGKTTTLRMLTGLLYPTSGRVVVDGFVPWEQRRALSRSIGLVFGQRSQLWGDLPVRESFDSLAVIYGLEKNAARARQDALVETLQIGDLLSQSARSLSLGQRMRCEIAASLLHAPKVLFLDEPTIGLDVEAKAILRDYLRSLSRVEDTTLILTSHDTGDIEDVCDRVIMIDHGRKIIDQPLTLLQGMFTAQRTLVLVTEEANPILHLRHGRIVNASAPHRLSVDYDPGQDDVTTLIRTAEAQVKIRDLSLESPSLETIIRRLYAGEVPT